MTSMYRPKADEERVVMFWHLGLDTYEIASRMGAREWDVYRVLSQWREKQHDQYNFAIPSQCEQVVENDEDGWDV
jgi:hypothetical protein